MGPNNGMEKSCMEFLGFEKDFSGVFGVTFPSNDNNNIIIKIMANQGESLHSMIDVFWNDKIISDIISDGKEKSCMEFHVLRKTLVEFLVSQFQVTTIK